MKKHPLGSASRPLWIGLLVAGLLTPLVVFSVVDVDTDAIFELDGNALTSTSGEDWDKIADDTSDALVYSFLSDVYPPASGDNIFMGGGSKDERDISGSGQVWGSAIGAPPDKNNLEHAFAAAYRSEDTDWDLHIYFGADRYDNSGDSAVGFWFFKDNVQDNGDGTFSGKHQVGDILVTSDFRNGGGVSVINVFKWVGGSKPLQLLISGTPALPGSANDPSCLKKDGINVACGIANRTATAVPAVWPGGYAFKGGGNNGDFPLSTLFEGGINITQLIGQSQTCFSSFMAMTRTSASTTAQLKDYVVGQFPLCGIQVAKSCDGGTTISPDGEHFRNEYTVSVTNTGIGTVYDAAFAETNAKLDGDDFVCQLTEINGSPVTPVNLVKNTPKVIAAELASGASATATVVCDTLDNPFDNQASASAYADGAKTLQLSAAATGSTPACEAFQIAGSLTIDKQCANRYDDSTPAQLITPAVSIGADFQPTVCVDITVTNDSNERVDNIIVTDDQVSTIAGNGFSLIPGASKEFKDLCYDPLAADTASSDPRDVTFTDTASAAGTGALTKGTVASSTVTATCALCPCEDCN